MSLVPGTYQIRLNASEKPALFNGEMPLDSPTFETVGEASIDFSIDDPTGVLVFCQPPVTWKDFSSGDNPPGNTTNVVEKTLTITVTPGKVEKIYFFNLHLNLGIIGQDFLPSEGPMIVDPTIVEKPAETPPPYSG
jgi:hypothetical protein